jgi:hypothetical protein
MGEGLEDQHTVELQRSSPRRTKALVLLESQLRHCLSKPNGITGGNYRFVLYTPRRSSFVLPDADRTGYLCSFLNRCTSSSRCRFLRENRLATIDQVYELGHV